MPEIDTEFSWDPARGGWGVITLDPFERELSVPPPALGAHFSLSSTVTIIVGMLLLSAMSMVIACVARNINNLMAVNWGRFMTITICGVSSLFVATVTMFVIAIDPSESDTHCNAVFVVAASFWVFTKTLLHMWFNEKLYIRRFMKDLEYKRWNAWYKVNTLGLGVGFAMMLWVTGRYYHAQVTSPECRIGVTHQSLLIWVVIYLFMTNAYMALSFVRLFPSISTLIRPFRHRLPHLRPNAIRPAIYIPPSIMPPKDGDLADNTFELDNLIVEQTARKERNKGILLCVLYAVTAIIPLGMVTCLVYTGRNANWWMYVVPAVVDTVVAGVVVGCYEGRPWRHWGLGRLIEARRRMKKARDLGICIECGWDEKEQERKKERERRGEFGRRIGYDVPWDQVEAGLYT
ncbi:hypothetical protein EX30DRAFT_360883 [Ascodesmis nigricans]|uniref:Uncharacterized protein n=1 Tax=Ascodesmis nigricans TaxID=341454 RepID=A0A4V3SJQ6_9PEZI|nr:hypothetical protein EX30DRAFT_360883 [Ascodesmis nigricans]